MQRLASSEVKQVGGGDGDWKSSILFVSIFVQFKANF